MERALEGANAKREFYGEEDQIYGEALALRELLEKRNTIPPNLRERKCFQKGKA